MFYRYNPVTNLRGYGKMKLLQMGWLSERGSL